MAGEDGQKAKQELRPLYRRKDKEQVLGEVKSTRIKNVELGTFLRVIET